MREGLVDPAFVLTSRDDPPGDLFQGYAFLGSDLVIGTTGAQSWQLGGNAPIGPGEDGCYLSVRRVGHALVLGTDYRGFARLFIYRSGRNWALGTSLMGLADHVRGLGWPLTANPSVLAGWMSPHPDYKHMQSRHSVFDEIELVGLARCLLVEDGAVREEPVAAHGNGRTAGPFDEFTATWISRLGTVLSNPGVSIRIDVSGGLDTRAVAALLFAAQEVGIDIDPQNVTYGVTVGPGREADERVAEDVARHLGVVLAKRLAGSARGTTDPHGSVSEWRLRNLGQYGTIRLPVDDPGEASLRIVGNGGENLRCVYPERSVAGFLAKKRSAYAHWIARPFDWLGEMIADEIRHAALPGDDDMLALVRYFRAFRSRFHAGASAERRVTVMPLAGCAADALAGAYGSPDLASRQALYDLIGGLAPGLLTLPFDVPSKAPTPEAVAKAVRRPLDPAAIRVGQIYKAPATSASTTPEPGAPGGGTRAFADAFQKLTPALERGDLPRSFVDPVVARLTYAATNGSDEVPRTRPDLHALWLFAELAEGLPKKGGRWIRRRRVLVEALRRRRS